MANNSTNSANEPKRLQDIIYDELNKIPDWIKIPAGTYIGYKMAPVWKSLEGAFTAALKTPIGKGGAGGGLLAGTGIAMLSYGDLIAGPMFDWSTPGRSEENKAQGRANVKRLVADPINKDLDYLFSDPIGWVKSSATLGPPDPNSVFMQSLSGFIGDLGTWFQNRGDQMHGSFLNQLGVIGNFFGNMFKPAAAAEPGYKKPSFVDDLKNIFGIKNLPKINLSSITSIPNTISKTWNTAKNYVLKNPIVAKAKTFVGNLLTEPKKTIQSAKSWALSNPVIGKAVAIAKPLYSTVVSWWDRAKSYVFGNPITPTIGGGVGAKGSAKSGKKKKSTHKSGARAEATSSFGQRIGSTVGNIIDTGIGIVKGVVSGISKFIFGRGPAGPSLSSNSLFSMASGYGGFQYKGYAGIGQSLGTTLSTMSGNCVDGTLAQLALASSFGIPAEMVMTTWNGNPHVYGRINGVDRDIANHALTGSWSRPPAGPGNSSGNIIVQKGAVVIEGPVYGINDLEKKMEKITLKVLDKETTFY